MTPTRANWYPRNAAPEAFEQTLCEQFGHLGGYVAVKLRDLCVLHRNPKVNDGSLDSSFGVLADLARCTVADAERVVRFAADAGLLVDLETTDGRFACRVAEWARDWDRGRESMKKRRQREAPNPAAAPAQPAASPVADQALIDEVVAILTAPREQGCEVIVDPGAMGVANIIRAHPKYTPDEHRNMARKAAADLANPGYRQRQAHRALENAYRQHEERAAGIQQAARGPKTGGVAPSRVVAQNTEREQRQAGRDTRRGSLDGSSLLQPTTVDATATEVS